MLELSLQTSFTTFSSRGTVASSAAALLVENVNSTSSLEIQDNNSISGSALGGSLNKIIDSNYYDYKMCCFERKMSAPKRLIDLGDWCPLSFCLNNYHHNRNTRQKHEE